MSADVWFQRDIANLLLATYESKAQTLSMFGSNQETARYHAGIRDTISTLALAFGISPALVIPDVAAPQIESENWLVSEP